ncbi:MAG TPA: hypothetical protein VMS56_05245 [Thermoanaerobaculia bacterium]|nr:hypothetical protein [Thermoanaerobaculia bacterium]
MRKTLVNKAQTLYITFFVLGATVLQAAPRRFESEAPVRSWEYIERTFEVARWIFAVCQVPIG